MAKMWFVARRDLMYHLRKKDFYWSTLGVPLLIGAIYLFAQVFGGDPSGQATANLFLPSTDRAHSIGVVDQSAVLKQHFEVISPTTLLQFDDRNVAEQALRQATIETLFIIPADYHQSGIVTRTTRTASVFDQADTNALRSLLAANQLRSPHIDFVPLLFEPISLSKAEAIGQNVRVAGNLSQNFAGSMVLMLRAQGIPARWVQGYATGDYDADRQVYVVRDTIAHSWPEVYFMGYGWIRFEPTPAGYVTVPIRPDGPPQAIDNSENPDDIGPNAGIVDQPTTNFDALQDLRENFQTTPIPTVEPQALPAEDVAAQVVESSPFWRWLAIICGVIGLIILLLWLLLQREFRGLRPAARAYGFIGLLARWAGLEQRPERTPQEFACDLAKEMPGQRRTLRRLADAYSAEQYGSQVRLDPEEIENDRAMVSRTLWPRSISRGWRSILQQILHPRWRRWPKSCFT